jgi:predicted glutamine amidotransferase
MCGICGYNGSKKVNIDTIKVLGILNEERGKDSAGIIINNKIYKKGNRTTFRELIQKIQLPNSSLRKNILVHTRAATVGGLSDDNAHPFYFKKDGSPGMFFMHNGTITNIQSLLTKYNIDFKNLNTDSQKLGKIIYEYGYSVLEEYEGAASLAFYFEDSPNILYLFNGAGKDPYAEDKMNAERDLYYAQLENSIYFSSQKNHLIAALNHNKNIFRVPFNTVVVFKEGNIIDNIPIKRDMYCYINYNSILGESIKNKKVITGYYNNGFSHKNLYTYRHLLSNSSTYLSIDYKNKVFYDFAKNVFFTKEVDKNHVYHNFDRYVDSNSKKYAHGMYKLNYLGKHDDKGTEYYFYNGYMIENKELYAKCKTNDDAIRNLSKHGIYDLTSVSEYVNFNSAYSKLTQVNSNYILDSFKDFLNGNFEIPFCPFFVYIENGKIKGFQINNDYISFFNIQEMERSLLINMKSNIKLLDTVVKNSGTYPKFHNFIKKCHENFTKNNQKEIKFSVGDKVKDDKYFKGVIGEIEKIDLNDYMYPIKVNFFKNMTAEQKNLYDDNLYGNDNNYICEYTIRGQYYQRHGEPITLSKCENSIFLLNSGTKNIKDSNDKEDEELLNILSGTNNETNHHSSNDEMFFENEYDTELELENYIEEEMIIIELAVSELIESINLKYEGIHLNKILKELKKIQSQINDFQQEMEIMR